MRLDWPVEIAGTGMSIPDRVVTNADFEKRLDTSDEWIVQRTGIRERRMAAPEQSTLDFASQAAQRALADAGITPADVDLIICATITPDHMLPALSCELQARIGCRCVPSFDVAAACSGFLYGLVTASQYVTTGLAKNVLLIGAECLTRITDMEDRATAVLFGDGAGAAVIRRATDPGRRLIAARLGADGARSDLIWVPAGGSKEPSSLRTVSERLHYMRMRGREVYKFAVTHIQELIAETLADAGVTSDDVHLLIPHQSNLRIIESAMEKMGLSEERVVINIQRFGNTSAASVPLALHEARSTGRMRPGELVLLVAIGAGLTWGSALLRV
ncbi:MAG: ketoacyl-ACP synthase III [Phycisphaerales bacterium]|nr:ketoacyl-ACP synthase III [Phycisphaerales bacterium]